MLAITSFHKIPHWKPGISALQNNFIQDLISLLIINMSIIKAPLMYRHYFNGKESNLLCNLKWTKRTTLIFKCWNPSRLMLSLLASVKLPKSQMGAWRDPIIPATRDTSVICFSDWNNSDRASHQSAGNNTTEIICYFLIRVKDSSDQWMLAFSGVSDKCSVSSPL